jgi:hypothetical protein
MSTWKRTFGAAAIGLLLIAGTPGTASAGGRHGHGHGHGHHHHGGSPGYWWGGYGYGYGYWPRPYYYPYYPYYPGPVVYAPRPVVVEQPVYVERDPAAAPAPQASSYWYYCESEGAYYPDVETCPEPWVPVPPRSE